MEKGHKSVSKRKEGRERMRPREQKVRGTAENQRWHQPLLEPQTPQAGECDLDVRLRISVSYSFLQHPGCQFRPSTPKSSLDGEASGRMSNF